MARPGHGATAVWVAGEPWLQPLGEAKLLGGLLQPSDRHQSRDATSSLPCNIYRTHGSHDPSLIRASLMSSVYTRLPHKGLMSVKTLETQKNAHHPTLAMPALVRLLQNLSSRSCTMHSWFDALLSGMAFRLLVALSQTQDGCLAACHSSNPPRNSSASAVGRHKKSSSSSLKFFVIG